MKRLCNLVWALLLVVVGTAHAAKDISIYQNEDKFKGQTIYFTDRQRPILEGGSFVSMRYVYFNFLALKPITDPAAAYAINIEANLQDWMFIKDGESLILKADDKIFTLKGLGSAANRRVAGSGVQETALWGLSIETLKKIAAAQKIEFRVYGSQGYLTGTFTDRMMQELRFFAEKAPELINDPSFKRSGPEPIETLPVPNTSPTKEAPLPGTA